MSAVKPSSVIVRLPAFLRSAAICGTVNAVNLIEFSTILPFFLKFNLLCANTHANVCSRQIKALNINLLQQEKEK